MSAELSPIVSEFETQEQAASYDRWFRARVQASLVLQSSAHLILVLVGLGPASAWH